MVSRGRSETRTGGRAATTGVILGDYALSVGKPSSALPTGWRWTQLTDVARLETGHTPSRKHPEYWGGDIPWIGTRDATANHGGTLRRTNQYTNETGIANSAARVLPANTVCLSRTASIGYVVVMGRPMATSQDFVNWVCSPLLDFRYLKYILLAERESFLRFASGTTHQTIYFPEVKAFHVAAPPIDEQKRIADTLSALDDRIESLCQTNATLEAIAQALFKSWFMDFDPVRAKSERREPEGIDAATATLFPASLEDWRSTVADYRVQSLVDAKVLVVGDGYRAKNSELGSPGVAFLRAGDLMAGRISPTRDLLSNVSLPGAKGKQAQQADTVFTSKGTIGRFAFVHALLETVVYSPQVCYWRSLDHGRIAPEYLHFWMRSALFSTQVDRVRGNAAIMDFVSLGDQRAMTLNLPSEPIQSRFAELVRPLMERMAANRAASDSLCDLRDTLLPRLISGKLRLPGAEAAIEEAIA